MRGLTFSVALAGGLLVVLGAAAAAQATGPQATGPIWGFHGGWAGYCYSHVDGKVRNPTFRRQFCPGLGEERISEEAQIARAAETGAGTIRLNAGWAEGFGRRQPPPPGEAHPYEWTALDFYYGAARQAGMRPIIAILDTPLWARREGWQEHCANPQGLPCAYPPRRDTLRNFGAWAEALMRRYPDALAIEVWNEPNTGRFWAPRPAPRLYARLLREAHVARVRSGFRGAIVLGGLAAARHSGAHRLSDARFLRRVYRHGRKQWFDGIGHHPYPFRSRGSAVGWAGRMNAHLNRVLRVRNRHGHRRAELWLTEIGIRGGGEGYEERTVPAARQGPILERLYNAASRRPVRAITFYTLTDTPFEGERWNGFGIVDARLRPKPAFCHLRHRLGRLSPC